MTNETNVNGNGNGNGHLHGGPSLDPESDSIFLDDAPEIMVESADPDDRRPELVRDEGDIAAGVDTERGFRPAEGRGRKRAVGVVFLLAMLVVGGFVLYFMFGAGGTRKARVPVNGSGSSNAQETDEAMTRQAINQIKSPGVTLTDGSVIMPQPSPFDQHQQVTQPVTESVTQLPGNGNMSATVSPTPASSGPVVQDSQQQQQSTISRLTSGGRNNERSLWIGEEAAQQKQPKQPERAGQDNSVSGVPVPPFGSMLPVRSLGAIFTLRSGGLARFELTRDVKGKGWSLPHGTVLVGALRGSEFDRAFITLIGFIDSETGKFVKISGDVLGSDGGAGVRGKRRKMSSSWTKVLGKLGEAGLNIAGGLASSIGRRPVIVSDAFGSVGYRVTNEFDGVLLNKDKNVFIEVAAGTTCYMMITQLPESVQGVDALAKFSGREVESRADSEQPRNSTGISERELAELMQSGDPERIRAAMPRMAPEMRRVAEAVLTQGEDR